MIYLNRPLNCQSACFPCCLQHIEVQSPPGTVIGTVDQDWTLCNPSFTIRDQSGEVALTMEGPCLTYSFCGDVEFKVRVRGKVVLYRDTVSLSRSSLDRGHF